MTKFFYDTEFLEDGTTIDLISIGIVREDGAEYYAVSTEADWGRIKKEQWLVDNVVPRLPPLSDAAWKLRDTIRDEIYEFLTEGGTKIPELWAWYSAYDHVALAQLFGRMIDFPPKMPMFTNDFRSYVDFVNPRLKHQLPQQTEGNHDALEDAKFLKLRYEFVEDWRASH